MNKTFNLWKCDMNILLFQNRAIGLRFTESLFFDSFENIIKIRKPI